MTLHMAIETRGLDINLQIFHVQKAVRLSIGNFQVPQTVLVGLILDRGYQNNVDQRSTIALRTADPVALKEPYQIVHRAIIPEGKIILTVAQDFAIFIRNLVVTPINVFHLVRGQGHVQKTPRTNSSF